MKQKGKFGLALIVISTFFGLAPAAIAYMQNLHSEEVREAFAVGRSTDPDTVKQFFEKYSRQFACPSSGLCVESIELRTPYEQVALRSRQHWDNYTEQDAERDYSARPKLVALHVFVLYALDFSDEDTDVSPSKDQPDGNDDVSNYGFRIRVSQEHSLKPKNVRSAPFYFGGSKCRYCGGEEIILDFDPAQLTAEIVHIEIAAPDGQIVQSEFDLRNLK